MALALSASLTRFTTCARNPVLSRPSEHLREACPARRSEPSPKRPRFPGMSPSLRLLAAGFLLLLGRPSLGDDPLWAQHPPRALRVDFGEGWADRWIEVRLASRSNRFFTVEVDGEPVLKVESTRSASAVWHRVAPASGDGHVLSWRWKVDGSLTGNRREREKRGDDYAARFFVIFDGEPFTRRARALCYVWAASEQVGSVYRNPYFPDVVTVVLQSGDARSGAWVMEERDVIRDYREAFGEPPDVLVAVAVMVDTDNTGSSATAWFDAITLEPARSEALSENPPDPTGR